MRVNKIVNDSTAEVKGHFSDLIYFQGCIRDCNFCFNPELKSFEGGSFMTVHTILDGLSEFSTVVVFTGGDPLCQDKKDLEILIESIKKAGKKVILETSFFDTKIYMLCDLVLLSIKKKSFDFNMLNRIKLHNNIQIVFVYGGTAFNSEDLKKCLKTDIEEWYIRYCDDKPFPPGSYVKIWNLFRRYRKKLRVFDKLQL